jgi:hypothetical protein
MAKYKIDGCICLHTTGLAKVELLEGHKDRYKTGVFNFFPQRPFFFPAVSPEGDAAEKKMVRADTNHGDLFTPFFEMEDTEGG